MFVSPLAPVVNDQRRGQKELFLEADMRVHPESAGDSEREVVVGGAARDWGSGDAGHPILFVRRGQAVPVDQAVGAEGIHHPYPVWPRYVGADAAGAV